MAERFKRLTVNQDHAGSSPVGYANMGCYTVSGSWAVCKTVVFDSGGSTPSHPTFICYIVLAVEDRICNPGRWVRLLYVAASVIFLISDTN